MTDPNLANLDGRVGGAVDGFDVTGQVGPHAVEVRLGGLSFGDDLHLSLSARRINGRLNWASVDIAAGPPLDWAPLR